MKPNETLWNSPLNNGNGVNGHGNHNGYHPNGSANGYHPKPDPEALGEDHVATSLETPLREDAFDLDDETIDRLGAFLTLLLETNKRFNLTAIKEPDEAWRRHILDSVSMLPFLGDAAAVIDVGSGGGLPGIPLAIACPAVRFTLLESTGKKARFLEQAVSELGLAHVTVVQARAEDAGRPGPHREAYDVAVARAIGPMNVLLELLMPLVKVGGRVQAMKGRRAEQELRDAGDALMLLGAGDVSVYGAMPGVEEEAVVVEVVKDAATQAQYPRRPGVPKQQPL